MMFVICMAWGEYDDYALRPMFICKTENEAYLFKSALENHEEPYWKKIEDYFEGYMPNDLSFEYRELEVLEL